MCILYVLIASYDCQIRVNSCVCSYYLSGIMQPIIYKYIWMHNAHTIAAAATATECYICYNIWMKYLMYNEIT